MRNRSHDKRWPCIRREVLVHLVTDAWPRVRLVHEEEVVPGVEVCGTGVHHRASLAVRIETAAGTIIAGDGFMRRENVSRLHPIGINERMEETLEAYHRPRRRYPGASPRSRRLGAPPGRPHRLTTGLGP
jgi:hypothetical protein